MDNRLKDDELKKVVGGTGEIGITGDEPIPVSRDEAAPFGTVTRYCSKCDKDTVFIRFAGNKARCSQCSVNPAWITLW